MSGIYFDALSHNLVFTEQQNEYRHCNIHEQYVNMVPPYYMVYQESVSQLQLGASVHRVQTFVLMCTYHRSIETTHGWVVPRLALQPCRAVVRQVNGVGGVLDVCESLAPGGRGHQPQEGKGPGHHQVLGESTGSQGHQLLAPTQPGFKTQLKNLSETLCN